MLLMHNTICIVTVVFVLFLKKLPFTTTPVEEAMKYVISKMTQNVTETWTTSELYAMYTAASGNLSRKYFVSNIKAYFGTEVLVLHIEGCDSILGFEASLGSVIKVVKVSHSQGDDDEVDKLIRKIMSVAMAMSSLVITILETMCIRGKSKRKYKRNSS